MPNWEQIAQRIARGMYGQEWDRQDKAKQDLAESTLRMDLARSGESRASRRFETEEEQSAYERSRRGAKEERESVDLAGAKGRNQAQTNENDVFTARGGAAGAAKRGEDEEKRKANTDKREGTRVGYEGRRLSLAEKQEADLQKSREVERAGGTLRNERAAIDNAIAGIDDPSLRVLLQMKAREYDTLLKESDDQEKLDAALEELKGLTSQYSANQSAVREARRRAKGPLRPQSVYDIFR